MLKIKWKLKCQKCEVGREGERERSTLRNRQMRELEKNTVSGTECGKGRKSPQQIVKREGKSKRRLLNKKDIPN